VAVAAAARASTCYGCSAPSRRWLARARAVARAEAHRRSSRSASIARYRERVAISRAASALSGHAAAWSGDAHSS
jgi:hypothetical protein